MIYEILFSIRDNGRAKRGDALLIYPNNFIEESKAKGHCQETEQTFYALKVEMSEEELRKFLSAIYRPSKLQLPSKIALHRKEWGIFTEVNKWIKKQYPHLSSKEKQELFKQEVEKRKREISISPEDIRAEINKQTEHIKRIKSYLNYRGEVDSEERVEEANKMLQKVDLYTFYINYKEMGLSEKQQADIFNPEISVPIDPDKIRSFVILKDKRKGK